MKQKKIIKRFAVMTVAAFLSLLCFSLPGYSQKQTSDLASEVASLQLGMKGYILGKQLTPEQKDLAGKNLIKDSFEGTYKFQDGEIIVVAEKDNDTVLAVYKRNEQATIEQAKKMISGLMGEYGEPTAMAHDKLIYWAYNDQGKIAEDAYQKHREKGEKFDVLATVKFNTTLDIMAEKKDKNETGTIYFIVSSDPLSQEFMGVK